MKKYIIELLQKRRDNAKVEKISELLRNEDFIPSVNPHTSSIKRIAFVTSYLDHHAGGMTSILRLGTLLTDEGFEVYYLTVAAQSEEELQVNASVNHHNYKGTVTNIDRFDNKSSDVLIATDWKSVYKVRRMSGYKMYFVQDFEPYFCGDGEYYILAKKTYELGLHMVSLGGWNEQEILKNVSGDVLIEHIDFPYEAKEYTMKKRDYRELSQKKRIKLVVYRKRAERRLPTVIPLMLKRVKELFAQDGIDLNVIFFGGPKSMPDIVGENIGQLSKQELNELYQNADFGMVASMTNISLIPYEMIATGLPLIEFSDGTFSFFFPENTAILTSFSYKDLYAKMKEAMLHPELLEVMQNRALAHLNELSWEKSAKQFAKILENITNRCFNE